MKPNTWIVGTVACTLGLMGAFAGFSMCLDIYGIFRNSKGRHLIAYGDERFAKYLLSAQYVPLNFDGILIGSSVSGNWNSGKISGFRVYNESALGANIVELEALVKQATERPGVQAAFLVVYPALTGSHVFNTMNLSGRMFWDALGSKTLLWAYAELAMTRLHLRRQEHDEFGTIYFEPHLRNARRERPPPGVPPRAEFEIDPVALKAYQQTISVLRMRHVRLIFIAPPIAEDLYTYERSAYQKYLSMFRSFMSPGDKLVDFTSDRYTWFRIDEANFLDGRHMSRSGADKVIALLNAELRDSSGLSER